MSRSRFFLVFALVLVLRVAVAGRFRGNFDTQSFLIVVRGVVSGQNIYALTDRYNYSPVWAFVATGIWKVSGGNVGAFVLLVGLLQTAADAASTGLLVGIGRRRLRLSADEAWRRALLFFSNPISVLISSAHGQFDGLAILGLLAALWLSAQRPSRRRPAGVAAMLSMSLLVKHVTAFHPLLFWRRVRRPGLSEAALAIPYAAFALSFLPFSGAGSAIWANVVGYGARGAKPSAWTALLEIPRGQRFVLFAILAGAVAWALAETAVRSCRARP